MDEKFCKRCIHIKNNIFCTQHQMFIYALNECTIRNEKPKRKRNSNSNNISRVWIVENKDGFSIIVNASSKNIARNYGVSELFNLGKNPNVQSVTMKTI